MSCIVSCICTNDTKGKVTRRGSAPAKPVSWEVRAWFVMPDGTKHTHSATVPGQTVLSLGPVMGAMIDSLVADHGNEVTSAGWTATSHGAKRKRK
jgi:hypothetical protein